MNQEEKIQTEYDEINLMDYVKVILKRKRLILVIFLIAVVAAGVFSYFSPKVYKADAFLEIGKVGEKVLEEPGQIVEKISSGIYGFFPGIKAKNPANTNLIIIEINSSNPQEAKDILEKINNLILEDHQKKIKGKKELLENDIEGTKRKISYLEEERKNLEAQVKILGITPLEKQSPNSQFAFFSIKERLEAKKEEIENLHLQINSLEKSLEDIQPTEIVKSPTISERPIKPEPILNISIAGILGIFLGIFLAFFKEWQEKNK